MRADFKFKVAHKVCLKEYLELSDVECDVDRAIGRLERHAGRYFRKIVKRDKCPKFLSKHNRLDILAYRIEELQMAVGNFEEGDAMQVGRRKDLDALLCALEPIRLKAEEASRNAMKKLWKRGTAGDRELVRLIWSCANTWWRETGKYPEDLLFDAPSRIVNPIHPILDALAVKMEHSTLKAILRRAPKA